MRSLLILLLVLPLTIISCKKEDIELEVSNQVIHEGLYLYDSVAYVYDNGMLGNHPDNATANEIVEITGNYWESPSYNGHFTLLNNNTQIQFESSFMIFNLIKADAAEIIIDRPLNSSGPGDPVAVRTWYFNL